MYKYAMIKEAEVAGVLSAFQDSGIMGHVHPYAFDSLVEKVAECLDDYYTVDDVLAVTDYFAGDSTVMMAKEAEDMLTAEVAPILGIAYLAKFAGEIDEYELDEFADAYIGSTILHQ